MIMIDTDGSMGSQDDYDEIMNEITDLDAELIETPDNEDILMKINKLKKQLKDDYGIIYDEIFGEDTK